MNLHVQILVLQVTSLASIFAAVTHKDFLQIYIQSMLNRFNMTCCNPVKTPFPWRFEALPATHEDAQISKDFPYEAIVGLLLYLSTIT